MSTPIFKCYYDQCGKIYQSLANLVRHLNVFHLNQSVYHCALCDSYFTSIENFFRHQKKRKQRRKKNFVSKEFLLSEHYYEEKSFYNPANILAQPVLPLIEEERKRLSFSYKLPINPDILSALYLDTFKIIK